MKDKAPPHFVKKISCAYENISPEKQYLLGAFGGYIYLCALISPQNLPPDLQPNLEALKSNPSGEMTFMFLALIFFLASADGARKIATKKLPYYKAFFQIYLGGKYQPDATMSDE